MSRLDWPTLSADYAQYHRTRGNRLCHLIGIPLIVFSLVYWTRWPSGNPVPWLVLLLPFYFFWSWRLGLGMALVIAVFAALSAVVPSWTAVAAFIVGWAFQFAGHRFFEGKSPAFTRNVIHVMVGPAWIMQESLTVCLSGASRNPDGP